MIDERLKWLSHKPQRQQRGHKKLNDEAMNFVVFLKEKCALGPACNE